MSDDDARQATPHHELIAQILDSRVPKNEREHAAAEEIERLTAERDAAIVDACRYRYVRNRMWHIHDNPVWREPRQHLDAAIDLAVEKGGSDE